MTSNSGSMNWKNVNNWHWIDKDCTKWAHAELRERLLRIEGVVAVEQLEGEVSVAQRKGKLRHLYDLSLKLKLEGGTHLMIRDWLSDIPMGEVTWSNGDSQERVLVALQEMMVQFERDLMKEHGEALLVSSPASEVPSAQARTMEETPRTIEEVEVKAPRATESLTSYSEQVEFNCRAQDLVNALTRGDMIRAWSRSQAQDLQPQQPFSLFDGNVQGKLLTNSSVELKMEWKLSHWTLPSMVTIRVEESSDRCILHLQQQGIPQADLDRVKHNWTNYYWNPIKMVFGYGYIIH